MSKKKNKKVTEEQKFEETVKDVSENFGDETCQAYIDHIIYEEPLDDLEYIYKKSNLRGIFAKIRNFINKKFRKH